MSRIYLLKDGKKRLLSESGVSQIELHELDKVQFEIQCLSTSPEVYIEDYQVSLKKQGNVFLSEEYQFFRESFGESKIRLYADGKSNEFLINVLARKVTCDKALEIIDFLYKRNPNLLKIDFSRTTIEKSLVSSQETNFEGFIDFSQNLINFLNKSRSNLKNLIKKKMSKKVNDFGGTVNPDDVIYNLDRIFYDENSSDVLINNHFYSIKDIRGEGFYDFYDFYENRVILSGLIYTKNQLYNIKKLLSGSTINKNFSFDKEYSNFKEGNFNFSKIILQVTSDGLLKRINIIINDLDNYINYLNKKLKINHTKPIYPRVTNTIKNSLFYKELFYIIRCLYECGTFGFNDVVSKFKVRSMSKIYEFFCFYKLEDVLLDLNFNITDRITDKHIPKKTTFENEEVFLDIIYEPEIPHIDDINESGLVRMSFGGNFNYYNPDYIINVRNKKTNKDAYYILDAKFRSYWSLSKYEELEKIKKKYFDDMRYVNTDKMSVSNQSIFGVCLVYPGDKKLFLSQQSNLFEKYVSLPIFNGIPMTNNFDKSYIGTLIEYTS